MSGILKAAFGRMGVCARLLPVMLASLAALAAPAAAQAQVVAPTVTAAFNASPIGVGSTRVLTITVTNPNTVALTGVSMAAAALPANVTFSNLNQSGQPGTPYCAGATFSGNALSFSGQTLAAGTSCQLALWAKPDVAGSYSYTTGVVSATGPQALTGSTATTTPLVAYITPVASDYAYPTAIPSNGGGAAATTFSVAAQVINTPTSYAVGSATTTAGGTVSITNAGLVSYTPPVGFSGSDTFTYRGSNIAGASALATVTVTVAAASPTITTISPAQGAADASAPPASVTITGSNFLTTGNAVTFGGMPATIVSESTTSLVVTPPASATGGLVSVVVTSSGGSATAVNAYRYLLPPVVTVNWSPDTVVGNQNTTFTLSVTNPNAVALNSVRVASNGANTPFILTQFGGTCGSGTYNANSGFTLLGFTLAANATCTVTSSQSTSSVGAYQFVTNAPTSTGTATTNVTLTGLPATSNTITAYQTPFISNASPNNGPLAGGTSITITGQRFYGATAVTIDGVPVTNVTVVSDTSITATVPAGVSSGAKTIAVTGPAGTGSRASSFTYNALPAAPVITGPVNGGSTSVQPTYSGTRSSGDAVVTVYVDGASIGTATPTGLSWSIRQPTTLAGGSHTVTATSTTAAGGTSAQSATTTFTVDATPPAPPTIVQPFPNNLKNRTPTLTGTAETGGTVTFHVDGSPVGTSPVDGSGNWSFTTGSLADGPHSFFVTATDAFGNVSAPSGSANLTIDNIAPATAVISSPADGFLTNAPLVLSGTGEPLSILDFRTSQGSFASGVQIPVSGSWTQTLNLGNGVYDFTVVASDFAGNVAAASNTVTVTVDKTAPAAPEITSYVEGSFVRTRDAWIGGTSEPGATITVTGSYPGTATANSSGVWGYLAPAVSADGPVSVTATATDAAGNISTSATRSWTIDTVPPAVPVFTTPSEGQALNTRSVVVSGLIEPFAHVNILLDGQPTAGFRTDGSGTFTYTVNGVADGPHTLSARAADRANNEGAYSSARSFTVDATAPAFPVLTSPAPGSVTDNASPTLSGTAEAGALITVYLDDFFLGQTTATGGVWSMPITTTLSDGAHGIKMSALDTAFNSSGLSPATTFQVDATPPGTPVITAPVDGSLTRNSTSTLEGTAEANSEVVITVDGVEGDTVTADGSGNWTSPLILADGAHTISVVSRDGVGNVSPASTEVTFTVDATAPAQPTITTPAMGATINEARPVFTGAAEADATVTLTFPGGATATATATRGGWTYTPTFDLTAGSNTVLVTATDLAGNTSPQAQVVFNFVPITITTTTLPSGRVGVTYEASIQVEGGSAPYTFDIIGGSLPLGIQLNRDTGVFSGDAGESGSFPITVQVSDTNYVVTSQSYTLVIDAAAPPVADPETVEVPATSTDGPTTIDLSGSVDNAIAIEIVTPPSNGSVTVDGLSVIYTPQPGWFGTVTFQYKAIGFNDGNSGGAESAPATVTVTIAAPVLTLGGPLPDGQIAQAYSQSLTAAGGTAPYTYAVTAGALPAGLTLAGDGTLSGAATAGGTFNFTVTATDSSIGTGPFSISNGYSLTIGAPAMTVTPATLPAATVAQAWSTTFGTAGGVAPYSYAVTAGALPAGLTMATDGTLSGTPTAGGAFSFTVTATDSSTGAGPYTASQAVTLTVNGSAITVTPTAVAGGTRGVVYSQSVSATGGVAPYSYAIASGSLPAGLTLSPQGVIAGTPTAIGTFTFDVRATDSATGAGPYAGVATVSLTVSAAAITVTPTTLPDVLAGTTYSQQMQASGGQGGYTYAVTTGGLPTGLTLSSAGLLSGRPSISGVFNFTITARDGFGNTGAAALTLTVNGRPDPSADADVRGLTTAQAEATRRMASTQIDNFTRRLEALHTGEGPQTVDLNLNLNGGAFTPLDQSQVVNRELAQATGRPGLGDERDLSGRGELARMMDARRSDAQVTSQGAPGPANGSVSSGGLRIWAGGAISLGERDATSQTAEFRIHTSGVSAGADMRVTDTLDFGLGVGFGQEKTDIGEQDSRLEADSWVGVAYGSWRPAENLFFDGMLGYGQMSFDTRRRTAVDDSLVTGDRDGSTWFGSVAAGVDRTVGSTRWIGYGRVEMQNAELDAYSEAGSPIWALSYDARELDSLQGALGVRYERLFELREQTLTPGVRLEWRREFSEGGVQTLRYADWLDGPAYAIGQDGWGRSELNVGLSLDWKASNGWSFSTGADTRFNDDQWLATMRLVLSKVF